MLEKRSHHCKEISIGVGALVAASTIYGLKRYFNGGTCYIEKDLNGYTAVVTGGNTGIGKETARKLADMGCFVIIGARDVGKNEAAVAELSKTARGKVTSLPLDLADKASIRKFAEEVQNLLQGSPLNFLVNNAGVMAIPERKQTEDGFEMQMGVNFFAHFYLTYLLWKSLRSARNFRVINLSSSAHGNLGEGFDIDFADLDYENGYKPWAAYSRSKKADLLFSVELQKRIYAAGLNGITISVHPGAVRTELLREYVHNPLRKLLFWVFTSPLYYLTFKSSLQGAQTTLYGLLEDPQNLIKGGYYADCKVGKVKSQQCKNHEAAKQLWECAEEKLGIKFEL